MPRIPYAELESLSDEMRALLGDKPANVGRMLAAASPPVCKGFFAFGQAFFNGSPLPADLREIAILRVGYLSNSKYEVYQHEALARHIGLTDVQIAAIQAGGAAAAALGEAGAAVIAFVDDVVRNVRASDECLAAVRKHLSDTEVVDLTLVTGKYMMVCRFLETTGIEIDGAPIAWSEHVPAS